MYDISIQIGFFPICNILIDNQKIQPNNLSDVISHKFLKSKYINELEYFMVNGEKLNLEEDSSTRDNPKKTLYKIELKNEKQFLIKSKYNRKYPLKNENYN